MVQLLKHDHTHIFLIQSLPALSGRRSVSVCSCAQQWTEYCPIKFVELDKSNSHPLHNGTSAHSSCSTHLCFSVHQRLYSAALFLYFVSLYQCCAARFCSGEATGVASMKTFWKLPSYTPLLQQLKILANVT